MVYKAGKNKLSALIDTREPKTQYHDIIKGVIKMLFGKKGFINGVYIVKVESFPKYRYFFTSAREAEKSYREQFDLKYKRITWTKAYY